jgi:cytidylate kinase
MLITISREYGAGGSTVARMVADTLRWRLVDNQVVEEVARRAGMAPEEVARLEERGPSFIERLARALTAATPELLGPEPLAVPEAEESRLVKLTEQVVADACADADTVVVGRGAVALLGRRDDTLHIKLVAPLDHRIRIVADRLGSDEEAAAKRIRDVDGHRRRYHRQWYDRDWGDPEGYHLTINTGRIGLEHAADLIVAAAPRAS